MHLFSSEHQRIFIKSFLLYILLFGLKTISHVVSCVCVYLCAVTYILYIYMYISSVVSISIYVDTHIHIYIHVYAYKYAFVFSETGTKPQDKITYVPNFTHSLLKHADIFHFFT